MFDFAWSELALIAVVALVVIGPKDLPRVMRIVGQWVQRARAIAREFQGSLDQMVREAELDEMKRNFERAASFDVGNEIHQAIDPGGELQRSLNEPVLTNPLLDAPKQDAAKPPEAAAPAETEAEPTPPALPEPPASPQAAPQVQPEPETHRS